MLRNTKEEKYFEGNMCELTLYFVLDINECSAKSDRCNVNAVCENTQGSYTCTCQAGYTGNGRTCTGKMFY